ncbi:hypothetical protein BpHYR1_043317 [Brachionus plicatilis]|uniref:Uncharacterized protein n=1 Tax=Brachionus plicatilis TaxID=10195 RepID=A0A3M7QHI5_BRAPC|nr:hypothetical protein BpHYR1_043317 [Brachionus plicatilis]
MQLLENGNYSEHLLSNNEIKKKKNEQNSLQKMLFKTQAFKDLYLLLWNIKIIHLCDLKSKYVKLNYKKLFIIFTGIPIIHKRIKFSAKIDSETTLKSHRLDRILLPSFYMNALLKILLPMLGVLFNDDQI